MSLKKSIRIWKVRPAFNDKRGSIYDVLEQNRIKHVGIIISKSKSTRGNHYHKKATQWTYVLEGRIIIHTKKLGQNSRVKRFEMNEGDIVELPPLTIHAIESIENSKLLVITDQPRIDNGYEYDTFRVKIA